MMKCIVTGGAGFIGSHLVDRLLARGDSVKVIDNLSSGRVSFIQSHFNDSHFTFVHADLTADAFSEEFRGADMVWHLAANPDVRLGVNDTGVHLKQNIIATHNVLEAMRIHGVKKAAFTSTSTIYGEAAVVPTPEHYGPLMPISLYGASKLACEALISSYCHTFDMQSYLYRFANIIGDRGTHGVIVDFIKKLRADKSRLEILGNGRQSKSYLDVSDCVEAMIFAAEHAEERVNIFNIGSEDRIDVTSIGKIVAGEMDLRDVRFDYTGGERGWKGDVPFMALSIDKLKALGWKPRYGSEDSVRMCVNALLKEGKEGTWIEEKEKSISTSASTIIASRSKTQKT